VTLKSHFLTSITPSASASVKQILTIVVGLSRLNEKRSSVIKLSKRTRSPALTASIQVEFSSRIARSSGAVGYAHM
jgi:hypothetical protein